MFKISTSRIFVLDMVEGSSMGDFILFKFLSLISSPSLPPVPSPLGCFGGFLTVSRVLIPGSTRYWGKLYLGSYECPSPFSLLLLKFFVSFSVTVLVRAV